MADAVNEIKADYEKKHPDVVLRTNYAGSGTLMNQIIEGSPADLFISASDKQMDTLAKKQLIDGDSRVELLKNELVLIVPKASSLELSSFQDVAGEDRFGLIGCHAVFSDSTGGLNVAVAVIHADDHEIFKFFHASLHLPDLSFCS